MTAASSESTASRRRWATWKNKLGSPVQQTSGVVDDFLWDKNDDAFLEEVARHNTTSPTPSLLQQPQYASPPRASIASARPGDVFYEEMAAAKHGFAPVLVDEAVYLIGGGISQHHLTEQQQQRNSDFSLASGSRPPSGASSGLSHAGSRGMGGGGGGMPALSSPSEASSSAPFTLPSPMSGRAELMRGAAAASAGSLYGPGFLAGSTAPSHAHQRASLGLPTNSSSSSGSSPTGATFAEDALEDLRGADGAEQSRRSSGIESDMELFEGSVDEHQTMRRPSISSELGWSGLTAHQADPPSPTAPNPTYAFPIDASTRLASPIPQWSQRRASPPSPERSLLVDAMGSPRSRSADMAAELELARSPPRAQVMATSASASPMTPPTRGSKKRFATPRGSGGEKRSLDADATPLMAASHSSPGVERQLGGRTSVDQWGSPLAAPIVSTSRETTPRKGFVKGLRKLMHGASSSPSSSIASLRSVAASQATSPPSSMSKASSRQSMQAKLRNGSPLDQSTNAQTLSEWQVSPDQAAAQQLPPPILAQSPHMSAVRLLREGYAIASRPSTAPSVQPPQRDSNAARMASPKPSLDASAAPGRRPSLSSIVTAPEPSESHRRGSSTGLAHAPSLSARRPSIESINSRLFTVPRAARERMSVFGTTPRPSTSGAEASPRRAHTRNSSRASVIEHLDHDEARRRSAAPFADAAAGYREGIEELDSADVGSMRPARPLRADERPGSAQSGHALMDGSNVMASFNAAHMQRWAAGVPTPPATNGQRRGSEASVMRFARSRRGSDASSLHGLPVSFTAGAEQQQQQPAQSPRLSMRSLLRNSISSAAGLHDSSALVEDLRSTHFANASVDDLSPGPASSFAVPEGKTARRSGISTADGTAVRPARRSFVGQGSKRWSGVIFGAASHKISSADISRPTSVASSTFSDAALDFVPGSAHKRVSDGDAPVVASHARSSASSSLSQRVVEGAMHADEAAPRSPQSPPPPAWTLPISPGAAARHSMRRPSASDSVSLDVAYMMHRGAASFSRMTQTQEEDYEAPASALQSLSLDVPRAAVRIASTGDLRASAQYAKRPTFGLDLQPDAAAAFDSIPSPIPPRSPAPPDAPSDAFDEDEDDLLLSASPAEEELDPLEALDEAAPPSRLALASLLKSPRPPPEDQPRSPGGAGYDDAELEMLADSGAESTASGSGSMAQSFTSTSADGFANVGRTPHWRSGSVELPKALVGAAPTIPRRGSSASVNQMRTSPSLESLRAASLAGVPARVAAGVIRQNKEAGASAAAAYAAAVRRPSSAASSRSRGSFDSNRGLTIAAGGEGRGYSFV